MGVSNFRSTEQWPRPAQVIHCLEGQGDLLGPTAGGKFPVRRGNGRGG